MTGLVLKLAPAEKFYLNGVLIQNGDRRSTLSILSPTAAVMRHRDWVPAEYAAQSEAHRLIVAWQSVVAGLETSTDVIADIRRQIRDFGLSVAQGEDPYKVWRRLKEKLQD